MKHYTRKMQSTGCAIILMLLASNAWAQPGTLQCHKVKDSNKFSMASVTLAASQAALQLPAGCVLKGKAAELCVSADDTVVNWGDAPRAVMGPGQELGANDYLCYKAKCPNVAFGDVYMTDQFGERSIQRIKSPRKVCVPAVEGAYPTTCNFGTDDTCLNYFDLVSCIPCCEQDQRCTDACLMANIEMCTDPYWNQECMYAVVAAGCGQSECC